MLTIYRKLMRVSTPCLNALLAKRIKKGKEHPHRTPERRGITEKTRPDGDLCWIHAASIGESQSALILINTLLETFPTLNVLVTTGTLTSAKLMEKQLPERAFHQFYPLDHPDWVAAFLDHWRPDTALWMESELWPNMLCEIKARNIPSALVNARLSPSSFRKWKLFKGAALSVLETFDVILAQNETEAEYFQALGHTNVHVTDNLKLSARPLKVNEADLKTLNNSVINRPNWVYASSHKGEEVLAARVHEKLKAQFPDLLTIIVPRHPERRDEIDSALKSFDLNIAFRGEGQLPPEKKTDIYVADTLGELGLFYRAAPIACIGRSFSDDGGGGHNPIEAAQLHCAVLHGPLVQNQQDLFDEMEKDGASILTRSEQHLNEALHELFSTPLKLQTARDNALKFAQDKTAVIDRVMEYVQPLVQDALMRKDAA